ncbi:endonuclease domain-containing protein [Microbispora bryophytorum]|uniref:endonuclease domain-containing protein n=1 Tax=Microbispora bryophytorum TaxID=1460882 RepID=UPI0033E1D5D5
MARSWRELPAGRVVYLHGDPDAVALAVDPLPDDAPALVTYVPRPAGTPAADTTATDTTGAGATGAGTPAAVVADVLRELESAALAMFPAWLPEAAGITGPGGAAVAAVRALALRTGSATGHFAPFLAHLAERALRERAAPGGVRRGVMAGDRTAGRAGTFPPEIRAAGLARVLRSGYRRPEAAILVRVPSGLTPASEEVLVAACEWLAHHGGFGVWLTGPPPRSVDRIETVTAPIPDGVAALAREIASGAREEPAPPALTFPPLTFPPLAGLPHPGSAAERRLEAALSPCAWAAGREWNQLHASGPLSNPIRVDLLWRAERCVVEIDGPEHLSPLHLAADSRRDLSLRRDGYAVRRFTNEQVLERLGTVLAELERFLHQCRNGTFEGSPHA